MIGFYPFLYQTVASCVLFIVSPSCSFSFSFSVVHMLHWTMATIFFRIHSLHLHIVFFPLAHWFFEQIKFFGRFFFTFWSQNFLHFILWLFELQSVEFIQSNCNNNLIGQCHYIYQRVVRLVCWRKKSFCHSISIAVYTSPSVSDTAYPLGNVDVKFSDANKTDQKISIMRVWDEGVEE